MAEVTTIAIGSTNMTRIKEAGMTDSTALPEPDARALAAY
jgi:hypothetical protein